MGGARTFLVTGNLQAAGYSDRLPVSLDRMPKQPHLVGELLGDPFRDVVRLRPFAGDQTWVGGENGVFGDREVVVEDVDDGHLWHVVQVKELGNPGVHGSRTGFGFEDRVRIDGALLRKHGVKHRLYRGRSNAPRNAVTDLVQGRERILGKDWLARAT